MSISNPWRVILSGFVIFALCAGLILADEMSHDILQYYLGLMKRAIATRSPIEAGTTYSYTTTTLFKYTDSHGVVGRVDTISARYFYSWGNLDSTVVISGELSKLEPFVPEYEDIFETDYLYHTFPNDTGGIEMGIGFDTPTDSLPYPTGLVIINRDTYVPLWLYLSYPEKQGYSRYSKSWRFVERKGLIFADSVWIVATKEGVFGSDNYRVETGVTDLKIGERSGEQTIPAGN